MRFTPLLFSHLADFPYFIGLSQHLPNAAKKLIYFLEKEFDGQILAPLTPQYVLNAANQDGKHEEQNNGFEQRLDQQHDRRSKQMRDKNAMGARSTPSSHDRTQARAVRKADKGIFTPDASLYDDGRQRIDQITGRHGLASQERPKPCGSPATRLFSILIFLIRTDSTQNVAASLMDSGQSHQINHDYF